MRERYNETIYEGANGKASLISARRVLLKILQYRPIFVLGDVVRPGQLEFQPGLTIKQAIAGVGGLGRPLSNLRPHDLLALERRRAQLRVLVSRDQARVWRMRQQLHRVSGSSTETTSNTLNVLDARFEQTEQRLLEKSRSDFEVEQAHLKAAIQRNRLTIKVLTQKHSVESQAALEDEKYLESMRGLVRRKVVTTDRLPAGASLRIMVLQ